MANVLQRQTTPAHSPPSSKSSKKVLWWDLLMKQNLRFGLDRSGGRTSRLLLTLHCLYRFLDNQKNTCSQFSVPCLREIHRNPKQTKKINSRESFFRKSPFCTFSSINPGFGRPWDKLWIFFLIAIFIMLQKNVFGQKKIQNSCTGSKVPVWQNWKIAKMALLNLGMKFKKKFDQKHSFKALWKWQ